MVLTGVRANSARGVEFEGHLSVTTRPALLVASLVTEGHKMSHFITQFYLECRILQTRLATLWTDPDPDLPSLAGILNHWLKSELSVKNLPRLLQPLSPNDPFFHH